MSMLKMEEPARGAKLLNFFVNIYNCKVVLVYENGLAVPFVSPRNSSSCYGVDFEEHGGSDLAFICKPLGPFCCKPSSIVETPKTDRWSSIDVQMDVVRVSRLVVVKESDSFPIGRRLSHGLISARLELSREMEVESDGTEEAINSGER